MATITPPTDKVYVGTPVKCYNPFKPPAPPPAPAPAPAPSKPADYEELRFDRTTMIPLLYGRKKVEGKPVPVGTIGDKIYIAYIFMEGPIGGFDEFFIDDIPATEYDGLYGLTPYTGSLDQPVDTDMQLVNPDWTDNLAGTAWVSAWFLADEKFSGLPTLSAWVRGKLVEDFRGGRAGVYTTNPVLCLVDLMRSRRYGGGIPDERIDFTSAIAAANVCEELVNGEKRFELNYFIQSATTVSRAIKYMLTHFCGERIYSEGVYKFFVHAPRNSVAAFTEKEVSNLTIQRPKRREVFNQIRATYYRYDTAQEDELTLETEAVKNGLEPLATSNIDLTGCSLFSQVNRVCVFELNKRILDLRVVFETHDTKGLERFDRFTLSHSMFGMVDVDFYVTDISGQKITAIEYDESIFSETAAAYDPLPEADLPLPFDLPEPPTNLSTIEYALEAIDSTYASYIACVWHPSPSPWLSGYEVSYKTDDLSDFVVYAVTDDTEVALWTTSRQVQMEIRVRALNRYGQKSNYISQTLYIQGKPDNPQWISGATLRAEIAGDTVILFWDRAFDADIARYELRRGAPGDTWDNSQEVAVIDSLSYPDPQCPQGTWQYIVRGVDNSHRMTAPLTVEVDVALTPDLGFSTIVRLELTGAQSENTIVYPGNTANDVAFPMIDRHATWNDRFSGGPTWTDSPGNRWVNIPLDPEAKWLETDPVDFGFNMTADFKMTYKNELVGDGAGATLTTKYYLSEDGTNWTEYDETEQITTTARYVKARFTWGVTDESSFWIVGEPVTIHSSAMPVIDYGTVNVDSSGVATVQFTQTFHAINRTKADLLGTSPGFAICGNLTLTDMTISVFDETGNPMAGTINWEVKGI